MSEKPDSSSVFFVNFSNTATDTNNWLELADQIKTEILGPNYNLAINIVSTTEIAALNKKWRQKDSPTDILSFTYNSDEGEVFICPDIIIDKSPQYDRSLGNYVWFILIHGLFHLKGYDHSREMEEKEQQIRNTFGI